VKIFDRLIEKSAERGGSFLVLIDPDRTRGQGLSKLVYTINKSDADGVLVGSSFLINNTFNDTVRKIKSETELPVILFPGGANQVSGYADAILYLSLISGRNPDYLFGQHVIAAPLLKELQLEVISTGYILIESGKPRSVEYITNTKPIPRDKKELVMAHALAAEYMGMKLIYLEGGSGADNTVPLSVISSVKDYISIPVMTGGGIKTPENARKMVEAGASFVVVGDAIEKNEDPGLINELAHAVHTIK